MLRWISILLWVMPLLAQLAPDGNPNPSKYPSSLVTLGDLSVYRNVTGTSALSTTLSAGINNSTLTIPVADESGFQAGLIAVIESERVAICSVSASTITVCTGGRGFQGTTPASHLISVAVTAKTAAVTRISSAITDVTLTILVQDGEVLLDDSVITIENERIKICTIVIDTLTVCAGGRGFDGSLASAHPALSQVRNFIVASSLNQAWAEIIAIEAELGATGSSNFYDLRTDENIGLHFMDIQGISVPPNPPAGTRRPFVNTATGEFSVRTSAGATVSLEGGGVGTHDLLSATHPDTTAAAVSRGSLVVGQTATPKWQELTVGGVETYLRSDGTDPAWSIITLSTNTTGDYVLDVTCGQGLTGCVAASEGATEALLLSTDGVRLTELDDDANTPVAGDILIVEAGANSVDYITQNAGTDVTTDLEEEGEINITVVTGNAIDDQVITGNGANTAAWRTVPDCNTENMLTYTQSTNTWGCESDTSGGTPAWEALVNTANTATLYTSDNVLELMDHNFTAAYGATDIAAQWTQLTGNVAAGFILADFRAADADTIVLRVGDGTNGITVSQAGALTAEGTGAITATLADSATAFFPSGTLEVGIGGTGAGAFTQGSVVFAGVSGVYTEDNSDLFWDNTAKELGAGTADPRQRFHVLTGGTSGFTGANRGMIITDSSGPRLAFEDTGETAGDRVFLIKYESQNLFFGSMNDAGSGFDVEKILVLQRDGNVGIGVSFPDELLHATKAVDGVSVLALFENSQAHAASSLNETAEARFGFGGNNDVARIVVGKENDYDGAGEDDSFMAFYTDLDGTATEGPRITSRGSLQMVSFAHAGLPSVANGSIVYCTDCLKGSDACSASSTGAMAMRVNGAWQCM